MSAPPRTVVLTGALTVVLTGATGYVGGRLLRLLEERGERVRCVARRPEALASRIAPGTEVVAGDVLDAASLAPALRGADAAFYLVHSMGSEDFEEQDRAAARNFGAAAAAAGVRRIVYVGGLASGGEELSPHLRSRHEVGRILRESGVAVVELRASVVIGSGSLSFEMVRSLVERLPVMVTPKWVKVRAQPIAIDDLLAYLVASLDLPDGPSRIFEIGGADQVCYEDLMRAYARQRGLPLRIVPVPVLTPRLSSLWLGLVTPLYARVGRKLIESISHPSLVQDPSALAAFAIRPVGVEEAIRRALAREDREYAETRWSDALSSAGAPRTWAGVRFGTRIVDSRTIEVAAPARNAFSVAESVGGENGWFAWNALWRIRGWIDLLAGGVGMRRGRPHPERLRAGDAVDWWRVESVEPGRRVRLAAEMKLPGRAWLELEATPTGPASSVLRQTAVFDPVGLAGLAYWYALYAVHVLVFRGMLREMARRAAARARAGRARAAGPSSA